MPAYRICVLALLCLLAVPVSASAQEPRREKACDVCAELVEVPAVASVTKDCDACPHRVDEPEPADMPKDCADCPELVVVPAGTFRMGSSPGEPGRDDDEGPAHDVTFDRPFAMGRTEVTFDQWDACVADHGCETVGDEGWGRGQRPVINVSHGQARAYTEWLAKKTGRGYRLPSEAEWEYAARAGVPVPASSDAAACLAANVYDATAAARYRFGWSSFPCGDGFAETAPVGRFAANAFGLHDMLGNVWEWVEDCHALTYDHAPNDGTASVQDGCRKRVSRGGAWNNMPQWVRVTYRYGLEPGRRSNNLGLRVVRDLP